MAKPRNQVGAEASPVDSAVARKQAISRRHWRSRFIHNGLEPVHDAEGGRRSAGAFEAACRPAAAGGAAGRSADGDGGAPAGERPAQPARASGSPLGGEAVARSATCRGVGLHSPRKNSATA